MRKLVIDNDELFGRVVELLQEGREVTIPSKGFSMLPFIRGERDLVVLERADEIKPGDIVLFRLDGRYILPAQTGLRPGGGNPPGRKTARGPEWPLAAVLGGRLVGPASGTPLVARDLSPAALERLVKRTIQTDSKMRIKEGFVMRVVCGENVISGEGLKQVNFSKLVSLNATASFLWKALQGVDFTAETMADLLTGEYEVDRETALKDSTALLEKWTELGFVE